MKTVKTIAICLPEYHIKFIDYMAEKCGCSRSFVIKRMIDEIWKDLGDTDEFREIFPYNGNKLKWEV